MGDLVGNINIVNLSYEPSRLPYRDRNDRSGSGYHHRQYYSVSHCDEARRKALLSLRINFFSWHKLLGCKKT